MILLSIPPTPSSARNLPIIRPSTTGFFGGPINKSASFFFNMDRRNINDLSATNAYSLNSALLPYNVVSAIPNPHGSALISPRESIGRQRKITRVTLRYQYYRDTENNQLGNALDLPTQAYYTQSTENTVQVSDTQVIGSKIINEQP